MSTFAHHSPVQSNPEPDSAPPLIVTLTGVVGYLVWQGVRALRRSGRGPVAAAVLFGAAIGWAAVLGGIAYGQHLAAEALNSHFAAPESLASTAGRPPFLVGTCYNFDDDGGLTALASCDRLHDFEVISTQVLPEGPYPGVEAMEEQTVAMCTTEFDARVPHDVAVATGLVEGGFYPAPEGWANGNREIVCLAEMVGGDRFAGTVSSIAALATPSEPEMTA